MSVSFFDQFDCDSVAFGEQLSPACISKMNEKVNAYNLILAGLVTDESVLPAGGGGRRKGKRRARGGPGRIAWGRTGGEGMETELCPG